MTRTPVSSSNLKSVGYDGLSQTLDIQFRSGHVYQYSNVPYSVYASLLSAPSHGKYFWRAIRGRFRYRRVN